MDEKRSQWKIFSVFLFVGTGIYFFALNNPFHFDDFHSIRYNPHLRSLSNVPYFFTDIYTFSGEQNRGMFRPLLLCSYALNYAIHGYALWGFRLFNILLHVGCSFYLFRCIFVTSQYKHFALLASWFYLLHPLAAEPINYISSRSDLFSSFFVLAALSIFLAEKSKLSLTGMGLFFAGLLVKSVSIVLPILIILVQRSSRLWLSIRTNFPTMISLMLLCLCYVGLIWSKKFLASSFNQAPRGLFEQIFTQIKAQVYTSLLCIMPVNLTVDHPLSASDLSFSIVMIASISLILSGIYFAVRSHRHWLSIGFLWQFVVLLPYAFIPLNLVFSERRIYLALVGFCIIISWGLRLWYKKNRYGRSVALVISFCFMSIALSRNDIWSSDVVLWQEAFRRGPNNSRAIINLAMAHYRVGDDERASDLVAKALSIDSNFADAWTLLGNLNYKDGKFEEALDCYRKAIKVDPNLSGGYYNLANALFDRGQTSESLNMFKMAIKLNPNFSMAHNNIGQLYEVLGNLKGAMRSYSDAIDIDMEMPQAYFNRATLYENLHQHSEALNDYRMAYRLMSNNNQSFSNNHRENAYYTRKALEGMERLQRYDSLNRGK